MSDEEQSKTYIVPIKKRQSPSDFYDGLLQGLKMSRDAIDKSIENFETTRQFFEASVKKESVPGNPDN